MAELSNSLGSGMKTSLKNMTLRFKEEESYCDKSRDNRFGEDLKHGKSRNRKKFKLDD